MTDTIDLNQVDVGLTTEESTILSPTSTTPPTTSSTPAAASSTSKSSKSASSSSNGNNNTAQLAQLRSLITDACHITSPVDGNDGNVFVHVIDGTGQFSCSPNDLTYLVLHSSTRPSDYSVVGIMGCQSTGKSTLLNLLFGTKFQEMDSSKGRSQTTKGVWMDSGAKKRDLVIMDLEGTDSGERGEDRTTFERQTSLYALAVAEVLLINMWEHDIGRYTASNYGILKTVFEVNLQLFDTQNKTVLMFVIRDHIEEDTPMDQLIVKLKKEVEKIWSEIRKPDKFASTPVDDLFELRFFALPHMKLQKQLFLQRVDELRNQFIVPSDPDFLFGSEFHGKKSVPADGFGKYMSNCWATIQENKELNLPTQKEMLATFRCDEIITQLYKDEFVTKLAPLKEAAQERLISDEFAQEVNPLLLSILHTYTDATKHYHAEIVANKKVEFLRKLSHELEEIFNNQARKFIAKGMMEVFKRELKLLLAVPTTINFAKDGRKKSSISISTDAPHPDFYQICEKAAALAHEYAGPELAKFQLEILSVDGADVAGLDEVNHKSLVGNWLSLVRKIEDELQSALDGASTLERGLQLKKLSFHLDKIFKTDLSQPLNILLKKANPDSMWFEVGKLYRKIYGNVIEEYVCKTLLPAYRVTDEESSTLIAQSEKQLSQLIRLIVEQHAGMIGTYMRSKFDRLFRSDSQGRIRTWTQGENIRKLFKYARDEALKQLDLFAIFRLDEYKEIDSPANQAAAAAEDELPASAKLSRRGSMKRGISQESSSDEKESVEDANEDEEKIGQTNIDYSQIEAVNIILDPTQRLEKETTFRFEIEGALREAEIAQAQNASNTKVPLWMIGLVCFLGMDEILAVLRNPLLLFFIVVVGGGAYMAHQVGALMPMISVAKATANELLKQAQASFVPTNPIPVAASTSSSTASSSSSSTSSTKRPSITRPSHERNLSLSKSYTDGEKTPPQLGKRSSLTSSEMLPTSLRQKDTVELQEMTTQPIEPEEVDVAFPSEQEKPKKRVSRKAE